MEETTDSAFNFENFYNFYHEMLGIPFNEREKARREWTLLSSEEQIKAINCVKAYAQSIRNPEHIKYACNYLRDKTYETYVNPSDYE